MRRSADLLIHRSVINVKKPAGITCREVDEKIKKLLNLKKVGHAGTLDKGASGVLIVALDEATKAMPILMFLDKEYEGMMYLHKNVALKELKRVVYEKFVGNIIQTPPVKSRVARRPRMRRVYFFEILEKEGKNVKFRVRVEAGTYIRKLVSDIGMELGIGAHLRELTRTMVGHFSIENSYTLEDVEKARKCRTLEKILIPIEDAIPHVKRVYVKDSAIPRIRNGSPVFPPDVLRVQESIKPKEIVGIFSSEDSLIALGIAKVSSRNILKTKSGSVVKTDRVFRGYEQSHENNS